MSTTQFMERSLVLALSNICDA